MRLRRPWKRTLFLPALAAERSVQVARRACSVCASLAHFLPTAAAARWKLRVAAAASLSLKEIVVPTGAFEICARPLPRRHFFGETAMPEIEGGVVSPPPPAELPTWIVTVAGFDVEVVVFARVGEGVGAFEVLVRRVDDLAVVGEAAERPVFRRRRDFDVAVVDRFGRRRFFAEAGVGIGAARA